jgi:hypothetical protein
VGVGKQGPNQGVATTKLLHHDAGHTDGGPRVALGMESAHNPKDNAKRIDSNAGLNSPYAADRQNRCEEKE